MPKIPNRKISQFVPSQFPEEIRADYPLFVDFLQAYFEWAELSGNVVDKVLNSLSYRDIDTTLNQFLQFFQFEFLPNIPTSALANKLTLVKHIKDFYKSRGTEKSFKFLFRILYNEDVNFYYPKLDLLKPDDGIWQVNTVIRTTTINNTFNFIQRSIIGLTSNATANVENVIQFNIGTNLVSEIYLSSIVGTFLEGEKISVYIGNATYQQELIFGIVNGFNISNPGTNYKINDPIEFSQVFSPWTAETLQWAQETRQWVNILDSGNGEGASASVLSVGGEDIGRVVSSEPITIPDPTNPTITDPATITLQNFTAQFLVELEGGFVSNIRILSKGKYYENPPTLTFNSGSATATAIINNGQVIYVSIDNPGSGYVSVPTLTATPPRADNYYNGMAITITNGKGNSEVNNITGYDAISNIATIDGNWSILPDNTSSYSIALGQIQSIQIKDFGVGYTVAPNVSLLNSGDNNCTLTSTIGGQGSYPGYFTNTNGFLDSNKYLQDDLFYQQFSYELQSSLSLDTYVDIVKKLLHPAGMILFGEVTSETSVLLSEEFGSFERFKFYYPPYSHYGNYFETNIGESSSPEFDYSSPNNGYWVEPNGYGNTQLFTFADIPLNLIIQTPEIKYNQVLDSYLKIFPVNTESLPPDELEAEYNCVIGMNPQTLYDVQTVQPPKNGFLGRIPSADSSDPVYNSLGLLFNGANQFATIGTVPVNPLNQTIIVVARVNNLSTTQSIVGCLDTNTTDITGYSIIVNTDGSVLFTVQLFNGVVNSLYSAFPAGTLVANQWFFASLRYVNGVLTANLNLELPVVNTFPIFIDNIDNNSSGYFLGNVGFTPPTSTSSIYSQCLYGVSLYSFLYSTSIFESEVIARWGENSWGTKPWGGSKIFEITTNPVAYEGYPLNGYVAYAIFYNKAISDNDLIQCYGYVKDKVSSRGIILP